MEFNLIFFLKTFFPNYLRVSLIHWFLWYDLSVLLSVASFINTCKKCFVAGMTWHFLSALRLIRYFLEISLVSLMYWSENSEEISLDGVGTSYEL